MPVKKNVIVYGKSLNLAGITACLEGDERLVVRLIDPHDSQVRQCRNVNRNKMEVYMESITRSLKPIKSIQHHVLWFEINS